MRVLPVIDILHQNVVRGVAGNREKYCPIRSRWSDCTSPLAVAEGLFHAFHTRRFYVADLDGILHRRPNRDDYRLMVQHGYELLVDAGVRELSDLERLLQTRVHGAIVGLETCRSPRLLAEVVRRFGPDRIHFSLDLRHGTPLLADDSEWPESAADQIADQAVASGVTQMIVLDLADVGSNTGGSTSEFCRRVLNRHPQLTLIAGGGVRSMDDVRSWSQVGIAELLVASALHDGRLSPADLAQEQFTPGW